ncbi:hypothetical protein DLJ53_20755 [Acuticoccus sediminis]|uniref:Uncharacterized protein n=1 Tax=Acuticoccus sediminis TaxID=2184697 RepID=A0A8B2NS03_9HYPH|nr:hypothetical protein [Acuticoccus sediminis]RAI00143.1 hypothetical protein DLJ53_20755 [Acuticoccus sediminis]
MTLTEIVEPSDGWYSFFKDLRIPDEPASIAEAHDALTAATASREAAAKRLEDAQRALASTKFGQAPVITHREVDELGECLAPAIEAEKAAKTERDKRRADYVAATKADLEDPLTRYHEALASRLVDIRDLLLVGAVFNQTSKASRVPLNSKLLEITPHVLTLIKEAEKLVGAVKPKFNNTSRKD